MARITHGQEMHRDAGGSGAPFEEDPGSPGTGGRFQSGYVIVTSFGGQSYLVLNDELAALSSGDDTLILSANQETPGGGNDTKIKMLGGHGVVVPILAADPAGGASEDGQIYYDSGTDKFRAYQDGAWIDLISTGGAGMAGELVTDTIIGDGAEDTFTLSVAPTGTWAMVSTNGSDLLPTEFAISGSDIIFDTAPDTDAEVLVTFITGGFTVPATDPGDIADPTLATAEDVALKLNALMAELRTAGIIA